MSAARAAELIAAAGGRRTRPRTAALAALLAAGRALSHAELQKRLAGIDRVSLYRALDWLAANGLAHRIAGADGVRRYGAAEHRHPHFHCTRCGRTTCLDQELRLPLRLPEGYALVDVEVIASGTCAQCGGTR